MRVVWSWLCLVAAPNRALALRVTAPSFSSLSSQIAFFIFSAGMSALWFIRWLRLTTELKRQVWGLLGWFSCLTCIGCITGAIGWGLFMRNNSQSLLFGKPGYLSTNGLFYETYASYFSGMAARFILYGIEVSCFSLATLMTLDRLLEYVVHGMQSELQASKNDSAWYSRRNTQLVGRGLIVVVVISCAAGLVARCVSAAIFLESSKMSHELANLCGATCNSTIVRSAAFKNWVDKAATAQNVLSAQLVLESVVLSTVALAFLAVLPLCAYINSKAQIFLNHTLIRFDALAAKHAFQSLTSSLIPQSPVSLSAPHGTSLIQPTHSKTSKVHNLVDNALQHAVAQRRRIVAACLVIAITFLPRSVFSVLSAYGSIGATPNSSCKQCEPCQNDRLLINTWLGLTPEISILLVAFSSPFAAAISLWCMMTRRDRALLATGNAVSESELTEASHAAGLLNEGMHIDLPQQHAHAAEHKHTQLQASNASVEGQWAPVPRR